MKSRLLLFPLLKVMKLIAEVVLHSNGIQEKGISGTGARYSHCSPNKHNDNALPP